MDMLSSIRGWAKAITDLGIVAVALVVEENGNEITVNFALRTNVEVIEDETVGLMGGELEDLEEGYEVEIEVASTNEDGSIICDSIACVS